MVKARKLSPVSSKPLSASQGEFWGEEPWVLCLSWLSNASAMLAIPTSGMPLESLHFYPFPLPPLSLLQATLTGHTPRSPTYTTIDTADGGQRWPLWTENRPCHVPADSAKSLVCSACSSPHLAWGHPSSESFTTPQSKLGPPAGLSHSQSRVESDLHGSFVWPVVICPCATLQIPRKPDSCPWLPDA